MQIGLIFSFFAYSTEKKECHRVTLYNPGLIGFLLKEDEAKQNAVA